MSIGDFPESLSQAILVRASLSREIGRMLHHTTKNIRPVL